MTGGDIDALTRCDPEQSDDRCLPVIRLPFTLGEGEQVEAEDFPTWLAAFALLQLHSSVGFEIIKVGEKEGLTLADEVRHGLARGVGQWHQCRRMHQSSAVCDHFEQLFLPGSFGLSLSTSPLFTSP